ncbi:RING finger and WD repeat domain-containing protein 2, partial [Rhizophlyctis rosea]
MLATLMDRRRRLENTEKQMEKALFSSFLKDMKRRKDEELKSLMNEIQGIQEDLDSLQQESSHDQQLHSDGSDTVDPAFGSSQARVPDDSNESVVGADVRHTPKGRKRPRETDFEFEGDEALKSLKFDPLSEEMSFRKQKLKQHMDDLEHYYIDWRSKARISTPETNLPETNEFSSSLARLSRINRFRTVATLHYAENLSNLASSIVSSIEFDKDDEFFTTAGVTKKIKVYEYANVVWDYREKGARGK